MPESISPRQQRILAFIRAHVREHHNSPTVREIGEACDVSSTYVVDYNLARLEEKGYITREPGKARSIRVRRTPVELLVAIAELLEDAPIPDDPAAIDAELRAFGYDPVEVGRKMEAIARRALAAARGSVS